MTNDRDDAENLQPRLNASTNSTESEDQCADQSVGYRRPPKQSQFKPGQSGNPRGRPRGAKPVSDILRSITGRMVSIQENGRTRRVTRLEAILLRVTGEATRGDLGALRVLLPLLEHHGESGQGIANSEAISSEDFAILRRYLPDIGRGESEHPAPEVDETKVRDDV